MGGYRTRAVLCYNSANRSSFHAVDDVVARSGDQVSVAQNLYITLDNLSARAVPPSNGADMSLAQEDDRT